MKLTIEEGQSPWAGPVTSHDQQPAATGLSDQRETSCELSSRQDFRQVSTLPPPPTHISEGRAYCYLLLSSFYYSYVLYVYIVPCFCIRVMGLISALGHDNCGGMALALPITYLFRMSLSPSACRTWGLSLTHSPRNVCVNSRQWRAQPCHDHA